LIWFIVLSREITEQVLHEMPDDVLLATIKKEFEKCEMEKKKLVDQQTKYRSENLKQKFQKSVHQALLKTKQPGPFNPCEGMPEEEEKRPKPLHSVINESEYEESHQSYALKPRSFQTQKKEAGSADDQPQITEPDEESVAQIDVKLPRLN